MENLETNEVNPQKTTETETTADDNKPKDNDIDIAVEALNYLNHGKRHILVKDYSSAVLSLQESCQLFDQRFGIGAEECGEAYLYYGTALLELARLEDGLFDGVVHTKLSDLSETEEEEEVEDEEEEESQDETETKETKPEDKKTDTEEDIEDSDEEKKRLLNENKTEAETSLSAPVAQSSASADTSAGSASECLPSTSKSEPNKEEEEEEDGDASNIEVSWEVLALAKNVFLRYVDKNDNKLKLAECLQKLGEISIEWENNTNAIENLTKCLTLRKEVLPEDDRLIAETYFHLGIAHSFNNQIESANNCFHSAIQVIESRINNLNQKKPTISAEDFESIESINREINQLENLLPEMRVKIEDSNDQMLNVKEALEREQNERIEENAMAFKNKEIQNMPITDVSHLIKRKRQNSGPESSPKKLCSNGHSVGDSNKTSDETPATT